MGLIEGTTEYAGKRSRTVYAITEAGEDALRAWLGTPISSFSMNFEAMLRIFVCPLGTKDEALYTLNQVRADAQAMLSFAGEVKQEFLEGSNVTEDQVYIRVLAVEFFVSLLNTVDAWADPTHAQVEAWDDLDPSDAKNAEGLEKMRQLPVETPSEPLRNVSVPPKSQMRSR